MIDSRIYHEAHFNDTDLMVAIISTDKTLITANPKLLKFSGACLDELIGMPYYELPWWSHSSALMNKVIFHIEDCFHGNRSFFISTHRSCNGELHEIDFKLKPVFDDDNEIMFIVATGYDVTEVLKHRNKTTTREKLFQALFENSSDGYFFSILEDPIALDKVKDNSICCDGLLTSIIEHLRIDKYNDSFKAITGTDKCDMKSVSMRLGVDDSLLHERMKEAIRSGFCSFSSAIADSDDGSTKHLNTTIISIILDSRFAGIVGIVKDETQSIVYLNEMKHFAHKDYLTGLNNRRRFFELASDMFPGTTSPGDVMSVAMLDIDHFKNINDTYGHDAGDVIIRDIAGIIDEHTRATGISARYGGEEFASLIRLNEGDAASLFEDIRKAIESTSFFHENIEIKATTSIGISQAKPGDASIDNAINRADVALYESKRTGRNRSTIFNPEVHGTESIDPLTGVYNEKGLLLRIDSLLTDMATQKHPFSLLYYSVEATSDDSSSHDRHLYTLANCLKKAVRSSDYIGRHGESGLAIALPHTHRGSISEIRKQIAHYLSVGLSFELNRTIRIHTSDTEIEYGAETSSSIFDRLIESSRTISSL